MTLRRRITRLIRAFAPKITSEGPAVDVSESGAVRVEVPPVPHESVEVVYAVRVVPPVVMLSIPPAREPGRLS
jgi:hypothetical protein